MDMSLMQLHTSAGKVCGKLMELAFGDQMKTTGQIALSLILYFSKIYPQTSIKIYA